MRFEEFLKEREYLLGVSQKTLTYYRCAFRSWEKHATDGAVLTWITGMKSAGNSNITINTYICAMRAYFKWAEPERPRIAYLKEEEKILATFTPEQVSRLIGGKAKGRGQIRARIVALTAVDTGMRIQELLNLKRSDVDFDNLCFRVNGKGNKQRLVPMSIELRKLLFRYLSGHQFDRVFCSVHGTEMDQRDMLRGFKSLCAGLSIRDVRCSWHTLRHTFAVNYLRAGGNVLYLQRILGHASLEMTNRYCRSLGIDDLKAVHNGLSLLSR